MRNESLIKNNIYENIFEQVPFGIAVAFNCYPDVSGDNTDARFNNMYEEITGRSKDELIRLGWAAITHPDDVEENISKYNDLLKGKIDGYSMDKRFIKPDGSVVWVDLTVSKLNLKDSRYNYMSIIQDITQRKAMENALRESERSKAVLLSNLPGMAYRCNYDRDWTMLFVSEGCYDLTGYKADSLLNNRDLSFNDMIAQEYRDLLWNHWERILSNKTPFKYEYEIITAQGQRKWVLELGQGIFEGETIVALEGIIIDITERKEQENKLKFISEHYELTCLHNQRYFEDIFFKESCTNKVYKRALLLINLKKIDSVSLTYGHNFSRRLIIELAEKLNKLNTGNRILFQLSLTRLAFYIKKYRDGGELIDFCHDIFNKIKEVQILNNLGCNIGILEIEENNWDTESIFKNSFTAAERISNNTYNYCFFDDELKAVVTRENNIKDELFKEVTENHAKGIYLQYQPILNLKTGKISGFEALARYKSGKLGLVSPAEFIPIAEEMQLIVPIGLRAIHNACKFIKRLEREGFCDINVSVNVSVIELLRDEFLGNIKALIENAEIDAQNLGIEVTESVIMENFDIINEKLFKLKEMGIEVSIDDFGTGYSSLSRESELHKNILKIDKYFIDKIIDQNDKIIAGDIISMAHKLGHLVVAEGVETKDQYQYLIDNDCDYVQGYFISKPLDEEEALEKLKETDLLKQNHIGN